MERSFSSTSLREASTGRTSSRNDLWLFWRTSVDNATNETGYAVERCSGSGCTNFARVASLAASAKSYTDAALPRTAFDGLAVEGVSRLDQALLAAF